MYFFRYNYH